jgi:transcriptional regulator with XRE-family HTH domain
MRELRGLTLTALAEAAACTKGYLSRLEAGEIESPGLRTVASIAAALGTDVAGLLDYEPQRNGAARTRDGRPSPQEEYAAYKVLRQSAPDSFQAFLEEEERNNRQLPADMVRLLLTISVRGRQPEQPEDWRFLHQAVNRSIRRA